MRVIRIAEKTDIPSMTEIWIKSFGDSAAYVGLFMEERLPSAAALVLLEDGAVMSQLFLLPGEISVSGERLPALYLYAAATEPDGRGRGYMSLLISAAKDYAENNKFAYIALVPGENRLYDYYSRFGFYEAFGYSLMRISRAELQKEADALAHKRTMTAAEMTAVRNRCFIGIDAFLWDENAVSFAARQHSLGGGKIICATDAFTMFYEDNGVAKVIELCDDKSGFGGVAALLLNETDAEAFEFRVPVGSAFITGETFRGGMVFETGRDGNFKKIKNAYMGLAME